jgi:DNA-binding transcriptional LysR family regulator
MNKDHLALGDLRVFVRVAELCHFGRAADSLELPKARVSQCVQALEAQLGVRLLQRTTRSVRLTPDGEAALDRARKLLADADDLAGHFRRHPAQLRGHVRLDVPVRLCLQFVTPALTDFLAAHPGLSVDLSSTDRRVALLEEGLDCVVRVGGLGDTRLIARPLGFVAQINVAAPSYLARHGVPLSLADLHTQGHRLVHYSQHLDDSDAVFEVAEPGGVQRHPLPMGLRVNHTDTYQAAAVAGLGLIQAPALGLGPALAAGRLVQVLAELVPPPLPVHLLWPPGRHLPARTRAVIEWLDATLRPHLSANPPSPPDNVGFT